MNVFVANEQTCPVDEERTLTLARHTLKEESIDEEAELSVLYVDRGHIKKLNHRFAGNDYATDVLAFPMSDDPEDEDGVYLLGDVVICPDIATENAAKLNHGVMRELDTLLIHGTLHLLGYDHQGVQDKEKMDKRLSEILERFKPGVEE
jgi:probable rRNA maturation factor